MGIQSRNDPARFLRFAILLLGLSVILGVLAALAFVWPQAGRWLPFRNLRPLHVTGAVFWILSAASGGLLFYVDRFSQATPSIVWLRRTFYILWTATLFSILGCFLFSKFGGREYWEFPPILSIPLLGAWICYACAYFLSVRQIKGSWPVYLWMWTTGVIFFLITYLESNLWIFPWFRDHIVRDITVQWKSNGAMVGSWNMMIYGTAIYLMSRLSGNQKVARSPQAFFFYFLGFTNLLFNWGHHTYFVPASPHLKTIAYTISMTEWIIFLNIIRGWRKTMKELNMLSRHPAANFILASEFWVFANLVLALLISIPAINRYTHGTHITVAHAMGTTIGINTMILLASLSYIFKVNPSNNSSLNFWLFFANASLFVFWLALIAAGIIKGIFTIRHPEVSFAMVMQAMSPLLWIFAIAGIFLATCILALIYLILKKQLPEKKPSLAVIAAEVSLN
jgi:nitric oxide reductase subunit B